MAGTLARARRLAQVLCDDTGQDRDRDRLHPPQQVRTLVQPAAEPQSENRKASGVNSRIAAAKACERLAANS
jgi:hypothetical protein